MKDKADYEAFTKRHLNAGVKVRDTLEDGEPVYIGIDAGSTTVKAVVTDKDGNIVCSRYMSNSGNPVPLMREFLLEVYTRFPQAEDLRLRGVPATAKTSSKTRFPSITAS